MATCGDSKFKLVQSFDIDNGLLSDKTQEESFVLGVEFGMAFAKAGDHRPFSIRIHESNETRIASMLANQKRSTAPKARNSGWVTLEVGGLS